MDLIQTLWIPSCWNIQCWSNLLSQLPHPSVILYPQFPSINSGYWYESLVLWWKRTFLHRAHAICSPVLYLSIAESVLLARSFPGVCRFDISVYLIWVECSRDESTSRLKWNLGKCGGFVNCGYLYLIVSEANSILSMKYGILTPSSVILTKWWCCYWKN